MSDLNSTTGERPRVQQGPLSPDNKHNKPELPDITFSRAEESNQNADIEAHHHEASPPGSGLPGNTLPKDPASAVLAALDSNKLTFYNINLVHDRGNALHMDWEQLQLQQHSHHILSGHPTSNHPPKEASGAVMSQADESPVQPALQAPVNGGASKPEDIVSFIRNKICSSLVKSAFDARDYLPLDQLCNILSPSVVHQLLLEHFKEPKASEYEREILGTRRRIFAILVMARQVSRLVKFIDDDIDDTALPLHFKQTQQGSRVSYTLHPQDEICQQGDYSCQNESTQDEHMRKEFDVWPCDAAQDFMLWQPIIHVPFFKFPGDRIYFYDLRQDSVLPFDDYNQQVDGGYGSVRKATIHPSHYNRGRNSKYPQHNCFAIKKPHIPSLHDYLQEIEPFDRLGAENDSPDLKHLIPLQLTFRHGRDYYLVFPWADGNLKTFWRKQRADPADPARVCWFMAQCSGIALGLRRLHHLSTQLSQNVVGLNAVNAVNGTKIILGGGKDWGRHGDIKPENILWFENYNDERDVLVISDFGLTQFNSAHSRSKVHQDQILGYSGTYRPPDLQLEGQDISPKYDVWSLGCVFLEFLSWFLLGYEEAIEGFAQKRADDSLQGNVKEDTFFTFEKGKKNPDGTSNEATLKKSVVEWIEKLHKNSQCSEPFHALLDLIQFTMLVPNPDNRWKCGPAERELRTLKTKCGKNDYTTKHTPKGPDPDRYPKAPEKARTADSSPEPLPKELQGIEGSIRGTQVPGSTIRAATDEKPILARARGPAKRGCENEVQDSGLTSSPDGTFEPQASATLLGVSIGTAHKSQCTDIPPSTPDQTQESTEPQVANPGARLERIPRTLGLNNAAKDSSDNLTNGYGPSEKTMNNAETGTESTTDEAASRDFPDDNAGEEAKPNNFKTQPVNEESPETYPKNSEPLNYTSSPDAGLGRSFPTEPSNVGQHSATDAAQPVISGASKWQSLKKRLGSFWGMVVCC